MDKIQRTAAEMMKGQKDKASRKAREVGLEGADLQVSIVPPFFLVLSLQVS